MKKIDAVVFDFGGVLIDWNPRYLYRKVFDNEQEMEWFLSEICTPEWNTMQDGGKRFSEATAELSAKYPEYSDKIALYYGRWEEMLGGEIDGTSSVICELKSAGMPLYGLTNWSDEAFPVAYDRYDSLKAFNGIVVSGEEKLLKPDHAIFRVLIERYGLKPDKCVFIDDNKTNVDSAAQLGFIAIHFRSASHLREELVRLGVLPQ